MVGIGFSSILYWRTKYSQSSMYLIFKTHTSLLPIHKNKQKKTFNSISIQMWKKKKKNKCVILDLIFLILLLGFSIASATPTAVLGIVTNVVPALFHWVVSLISETEPDISIRSTMKFEKGYKVETIFDAQKFGIDPHSAVVSPVGEQIFISDSENNNIYKISAPLSLYSQPVLITGSPEGCCGHIDGELRNARMNRPKGLAVDDIGNVYVADTTNMAIRKISTNGVVTIAGGKWLKGEDGDMERGTEDAKLSNDFDVVYVRSSCSLLVIDRGNRAIKAIQLHKTDCSHHYHHNHSHPGTSLLFAACLFGYMLSPLQRRIGAIFSSNCSKKSESELRSPSSLGRALLNTCSSVVKFCTPSRFRSTNQSYAVHHREEIRTKQHSSVAKEKNGGFRQHHHKKQTSRPWTHYMEEHSSQRTTEMIVFGSVQEDEGFRQSIYYGDEHS